MNSSVRRSAWALAGVTLGVALAAWPSARQPGQPTLTVPDGFEVVRVAGPPLVERPIVADFDEEGRLYVAESSGSNAKVEQQLAEKPHRVLRLEDADGDGVFDRRTVFADRMMLPEGAMWFDGSLYVSAPPSIWKLTDTDGDGVADVREEWFQGKTLTGCANDLHGPYLGPDGWIYWAKGAFAEQTYERPGQPPLVTKAAHIFRRRPGDAIVEAGADRRHGQPRRRRLHRDRRSPHHRDVPRASAARQARRPHSRRLRRRLRQGARRHRRTPADRRPAGAGLPSRAGGAGGPDARDRRRASPSRAARPSTPRSSTCRR